LFLVLRSNNIINDLIKSFYKTISAYCTWCLYKPFSVIYSMKSEFSSDFRTIHNTGFILFICEN